VSGDAAPDGTAGSAADPAAPAPSGTLGHDPADDDRPVSWREHGIEDGVVLLLFWTLAVVVFVQFFTRYVLNDALGWTEEIARYLLIAVGFVGSVMAVRRDSHIRVEVLDRWLPAGAARRLRVAVDLICVAFFAWGTVLAWQVFELTRRQQMISIDLSKGWIYGPVVAAFAAMTVRGAVLLVRHRRGLGRAVTPGGEATRP